MSHNREREEKICLNCNNELHGRFCHVCGQENIETKESFWVLAKHFVFDILHFDGKFFYTIKHLFTRPGKVAKQYVEGKRASYLHHIRMYLFTSAVFFFVFFSLEGFTIDEDTSHDNLTKKERLSLARKWQKRVDKNPADSHLRQRIAILQDSTVPVNLDSLGWEENHTVVNIGSGKSYTSAAEYDSAQNALPVQERDGWFSRRLALQTIKANAKYGRNQEGLKSFSDGLIHKLPYLLFLSLPFFALLLKLLYIRRKAFYYSDHAVFTLYHYVLSFMLMLLFFGVDALKDWSGWGVLGVLLTILLLSWPMYLYLQMKHFYGQGYLKTFGKFLLLNLLGLFVIIILFFLFILLSIFQV